MITADVLRRIMPRAGANADVYAPLLEATRQRWVGDDRSHVAMWLAQVAHESGQLRYVREIASGEAYEGRRDLGNTQAGDGVKYAGRGLIQLTGRDNYVRAGAALGLPLIDRPELLEEPENAAAVTGWFWDWAGCGRLMSAEDPVLAVTRKINGGTNGLEYRRRYYESALAALLEQPAPIVEAVPVIVNEEKPVAPIIAAALQALIPAIPDLARVFSSGSKSAERNIQAAEKVVQIVQEATGAVNAQQAVERVLSDPQAQLLAQAAIRKEYFELLQLSEKSTSSARDFAKEWNNGDPMIKIGGFSMRFVEVLSVLLLLLSAAGGMIVLLGDEFAAELKASVVTLILIGGFSAVISFWLGSSRGSEVKTEMMNRKD